MFPDEEFVEANKMDEFNQKRSEMINKLDDFFVICTKQNA